LDNNTFWLAVALLLVLEGLVPFMSPATWRRAFVQILKLNDGQLRFFGLSSLLLGLALIWWLA
jgi:uncharacterized protein YjeT (DUF2065 family)